MNSDSNLIAGGEHHNSPLHLSLTMDAMPSPEWPTKPPRWATFCYWLGQAWQQLPGRKTVAAILMLAGAHRGWWPIQ